MPPGLGGVCPCNWGTPGMSPARVSTVRVVGRLSALTLRQVYKPMPKEGPSI